MANETQDDFLGDLKEKADKDPFKPEEEDPFASLNKEEVKMEEEEPVEKVEEKPLPFHKDPRVQKYIEKEISKRIPESTAEEEKEDYFDGVISAFTKLVGNDTYEKVEALNTLKNSLEDLDRRAAERAIKHLESIQQQEQAIEAEYDEKLSDGFETIEEETGIDLYAPQNKKLRIQFIDFVEKVAPKENGEISELPDIAETFKAFAATKRTSSQTQKSKDMASRTMERSGEVVPQKETGRLTWDSVTEKIFGK